MASNLLYNEDTLSRSKGPLLEDARHLDGVLEAILVVSESDLDN